MESGKDSSTKRRAKSSTSGASKNAAFRASNRQGQQQQQQKLTSDSEPAAPQSIEDVARLFIGDAAVVEEFVKANSIAAQCQRGVKRPRDAPASVPTEAVNTQLQQKKSAGDQTAGPLASSTRHLVRSAVAAGTKKERRGQAKKSDVKAEGAGAEVADEDVALSRAVQAQALSFLQRLSPSRSKAFWGLRDVAQGNAPKAVRLSSSSAAAAGPASPPTSSKSSRKGAFKEKGKKKHRVLADDGEELWRVGGPYLASDDEESGGGDGRYFGGRFKPPARGGDDDSDINSDPLSSSASTSSEPSLVTDSSEDDMVEDESDPVSAYSSDDGHGNEVRTKGKCGSASKGGRGMHRGGGRLFQSGDDIWDDEDD
ncbi:hypothetical protein ABL78_6793 [Leptomonas seymouri]|uniref:Uncharacterized protein n=1 Tax=Leptomonas seymouri TaxID=5684 RepID=A0A0N0P3X1_LEPSE|nr:hypothetical protein ABL78_6793 [Leptomonas seymouri]|eukprot:KPI84147.1 hypothetical protein ABL78_6793 [Leptomonas seymouri]